MKTILVIGGAGYLGKVILYFLNKSDEYYVYILIRSKKGKSSKERYFDIVNSMLLSSIKFEFIEGDANSLNSIDKKIDIVINTMAAVDFDLHFNKALEANFINSKKVFEFCKRNNVSQFLHVSTAYVCDYRQPEIYETIPVYGELMGLKSHEIISSIKANRFNYNTVFPNTYVLTKLLFEMYLDENKDNVNFNIQIVRPSIIVAALCEPYISYCDSFAAYMGYHCIAKKGMVKSIRSKNCEMNLIPVDLVCERIIKTINENAKFDIQFAVNHCPPNTREIETMYNSLNKNKIKVINNKSLYYKAMDKLFVTYPLKLHTSISILKGRNEYNKQKRKQDIILKIESIFDHFVNTTYKFIASDPIFVDNSAMMKACDDAVVRMLKGK